MKTYMQTVDVQSKGLHPTFHEITGEIREAVKKSNIQNGICTIYSHHTTCSVMIQECSHDLTYFGLEYLQQDLCNIMEKLVPTCRVEGQYMHPGAKHIDFAMNEAKEEGEWTSLNTDAHLRSCFFGRSETLVIENGKPDLGEFGFVYFIDWDQVRARPRQVKLHLIGE